VIQPVKRVLYAFARWWRGEDNVEFKADIRTPVTSPEAPPLRRAVPYKGLVTARSQLEAAELARQNYLVLVKNDSGNPKWLVMLCPCGCDEVRRISLSQSVKPRWRYHLDDLNRISLYPSVHFRGECAAHFVLRENVAYLYWY
jgi:hypothetical protein